VPRLCGCFDSQASSSTKQGGPASSLVLSSTMAILSNLFLLISLGALSTAFTLHNETHSDEWTWPKSYIALGDSYASGVGAGHFFKPYNKQVKMCKRFDGSYPSQVKDSLGIQQFDFVACSGNSLDDLSVQYERLGNKSAELVTVSISGNDFLFGKAVERCVYNYYLAGSVSPHSDRQRDKKCRKALRESRALVEGSQRKDEKSIWTRYEEEVDRIVSTRLSTANPNSILIITGYAKFFATPKEKSDVCDGKRFPLYDLKRTKSNLLHKKVRHEMNDLVHQVNTQIRDRIASRHPGKIAFIDIDPLFHKHRFCESSPEDQVPGSRTEDSDNVYFNSLISKIQEPKRKLGRSFIFHPKTQAHKAIAEEIRMEVLFRFNAITGTVPSSLTTAGTD